MTAVAVYMPHCGYDFSVFEETYDQLRCALDQISRKKRRVLLGGDFNTTLNVGIRGLHLHNLVNGYGLKITNALNDPWTDQWAFKSMLGDLRKIDFVLVSKVMDVHSAKASDELDLGSDHRAVKAVLVLRKRCYYIGARQKNMKGWQPQCDTSGNCGRKCCNLQW